MRPKSRPSYFTKKAGSDFFDHADQYLRMLCASRQSFKCEAYTVVAPVAWYYNIPPANPILIASNAVPEVQVCTRVFLGV